MNSEPSLTPRPARSALLGVVLALLAALLAPAPAQADEDNWGWLAGRVTDAAGGPTGVVDGVARSGESSYRFDTEPDGTWEVDVPAGVAYTIDLAAESDSFEALTLPGPFTVARAVGTRVPEARLSRYVVTGRVLSSTGRAPIAGAEVELVQLFGEAPAYDDHEIVAQTATDAEGRYTFTGMQIGPGVTYTVGAAAAGHRSSYLGGDRDPAWGTPLAADRSVSAPDLELEAAPHVRGTVRVEGAGGPVPLAKVDVELYRWDEEGREFVMVGTERSRSNGSYAVELFESGLHTLRFATWEVADRADPGWLGGSPPTSPDDPGVFDVPDLRVEVTKDHVLQAPLTASGTYLASDGVARAGISVVVHVWDGTFYSPTDATATTGPDGGFAVRVPRNANVTFEFQQPGADPVFLGGGSEVSALPEGPHSVAVGSSPIDLGRLVAGVPTALPEPTPTPTPTPTTAPVPTPAPPVPASPAPAPGPASAPPPPATPPPTLDLASSKVALKVDRKKSTRKKVVLVVTVKVAAGGSTAGVVQLEAGKKVLGKRTLRAGAGKVTLTIKAKKLAKLRKKGRVRLSARFVGNPQTASSVSRPVKP